MNSKAVISDTSSLIALESIMELELLQKMFREIYITDEIQKEFGSKLPSWIKVKKLHDRTMLQVITLELDLGEASGIALALEMPDSLLIIDEKKGRNYANRLGINMIGILGVLIRAKEKGIIETLKPILNKLNDCDFRMSEKLVTDILKRVGELK
ncbi:MAG: DUF3368 domain-containing protein [Bacteroidetes bacterium]|nr:DUF3368 domain-containing protein [Bacteroidota bacterium]